MTQSYAHKPKDQWRPLFFRVLQSRITDWHRRQQVRNRWRVWLDKLGHHKADDDDTDMDVADFVDPASEQPEQALLNRHSSEALNRAIGELPLMQRQALMLRLWEGFSVEDCAEIMNCPEGTVKSYYFRALKRLREQLEAYQP